MTSDQKDAHNTCNLCTTPQPVFSHWTALAEHLLSEHFGTPESRDAHHALIRRLKIGVESADSIYKASRERWRLAVNDLIPPGIPHPSASVSVDEALAYAISVNKSVRESVEEQARELEVILENHRDRSRKLGDWRQKISTALGKKPGDINFTLDEAVEEIQALQNKVKDLEGESEQPRIVREQKVTIQKVVNALYGVSETVGTWDGAILDLAVEADMSEDDTRSALNQMYDLGLARFGSSSGKWILTDKGREMAQPTESHAPAFEVKVDSSYYQILVSLVDNDIHQQGLARSLSSIADAVDMQKSRVHEDLEKMKDQGLVVEHTTYGQPMWSLTPKGESVLKDIAEKVAQPKSSGILEIMTVVQHGQRTKHYRLGTQDWVGITSLSKTLKVWDGAKGVFHQFTEET